MTGAPDRQAELDDEGRAAGEWSSLAALVDEARDVGGVEAEVALAGLRRRMFAAGDAEVRVGRYRVLEPIGRGGMGVVYRAHDPALGRDVALKLLRGYASGHERRLRREARAMARLSHPNVVAVLEVGWHASTSAAAEAFVVMELVPGRDAAAWLAARERSWREVLEVFLAAGRGLAAAHAVGLVHRDFKPSNVLVGDDGRVRVTDFGLAASEPWTPASAPPAASERVPGISAHPDTWHGATATGARVGTPRYMAPEQHDGARVDHRADQWAFAVSLWEALYGEHPFVDPATGAIDVTRPLPTRPGPRRGVPAALGRELVRALSIDPERRHASLMTLLDRASAAAGRKRRVALGIGAAGMLVAAGAVALASAPRPMARCQPGAVLGDTWSADRRAALAEGFAATGLPFATLAWASVETRVDEWVGRWSEAYGSTCEAAADAPVPGVDASMSCLRADLAELRALLRLLEAPDRELVTRAERATRDLPAPERCAEDRPALAGVDPRALAAHEERMAEVRALGRAGRFGDARRLAAAAVEAVPDVPLLRAETLLSLGLNHNRDGDVEAAVTSLDAAYYAAAASEDPDLTARAALAMVTLELRRAAHARAEEWIRHATSWIERVDDPARRGELEQEVRLSTGELHYDQGRYDEAVAVLEQARSMADDETSAFVPRLLNQLGLAHVERGEHERAAELFVRAAELERRRSGATHPQVASAISNLGNAYWYRGDYDAAERAYQEAHAIRLASLGPEHPSTAATLLNLGIVADVRGDRPRAVSLLEQAVAAFSAALGPEHPETAHARTNLAATLGGLGEWDRAIALHREAIASYEAALGPEHPRATEARMNLATALAETERLPEAHALLERALAETEAAHGREHERYAAVLREQAAVLRRMGDAAGAELRNRQALALQERVLGLEHPELAVVLTALADGALEARRLDEGAALAERALAVGPTSALVRGKAGYLLARARWEGRRDLARVPELLDDAERELVAAGDNASEILRRLRGFRAELGSLEP